MAFAGGESPVLSAEMLAMKMESLKNCEDFRFVVKSQDGKDEVNFNYNFFNIVC